MRYNLKCPNCMKDYKNKKSLEKHVLICEELERVKEMNFLKKTQQLLNSKRHRFMFKVDTPTKEKLIKKVEKLNLSVSEYVRGLVLRDLR